MSDHTPWSGQTEITAEYLDQWTDPHTGTVRVKAELLRDLLRRANAPSFQQQVRSWLVDCLGGDCADDKRERAYRFLEEALELFQAAGCSALEALDIIRYVYGRPTGELRQEVGGVMLTLAALCAAHERVDMEVCAAEELLRVYGRFDEIRQKQRTKPSGLPTPRRKLRQAEDVDQDGGGSAEGQSGDVHPHERRGT